MARGYSETEAETIIRESNKNRSPRCVEYWLNKGYTLEDAKIEVSKVQANNASYSKSTTKYWLNLGLNIEDAKKKASYYAKEHSVWTFNYWKKLGYSDDEAKLKVHEINPSILSKYLFMFEILITFILALSKNAYLLESLTAIIIFKSWFLHK